MKKTTAIILLTSLMLSLAACGNGGASSSFLAPSRREKPEMELGSSSISSSAIDAEVLDTDAVEPGYTLYEKTEDGISFQHPENWVEISAELFENESVLEEFVNQGIDVERIKQSASQVAGMFFDLDNSSEDFAQNMNFIAAASPGITANLMFHSSQLPGLKGIIKEQYSSFSDSFEWIVEPEVRELGDNKVLYVVVKYRVAGEYLVAGQAVLVEDSKTYTFTHSIGDRDYIAEGEDVFLKLISTIKFF